MLGTPIPPAYLASGRKPKRPRKHKANHDRAMREVKFYLPPEVEEALDRFCTAKLVDVSRFVRHVVIAALNKQGALAGIHTADALPGQGAPSDTPL